MSNKIEVLPDLIPDIKFNLIAQEQFSTDKGISFEHFSAIPSPIGLKDRGDYRRPDSLDTIEENGFIYKKVGEFRTTIVGNSKSNGMEEGGIYDNSTARIIMPKYYDVTCGNQDKEISILPGDRIYAKGIEFKVGNYQRADYNPKGSDFLQFPAVSVSTLQDSLGNEYECGVHFKINKDGNISWIKGKKNPGIDPETGKGRVYSIRYKYLAFWYISQLLNEIRITNDVDGNPQRLPYHAMVQREYLYHNRKRGDAKDTNLENHTKRTNEQPKENIDPNQYEVKVNINSFE